MRKVRLLASSVDQTGRHTVFMVCDDDTFWQFDPHTDTYSEFPPIPQGKTKHPAPAWAVKPKES